MGLLSAVQLDGIGVADLGVFLVESSAVAKGVVVLADQLGAVLAVELVYWLDYLRSAAMKVFFSAVVKVTKWDIS